MANTGQENIQNMLMPCPIIAVDNNIANVLNDNANILNNNANVLNNNAYIFVPNIGPGAGVNGNNRDNREMCNQ